jgi:hypothetical protein
VHSSAPEVRNNNVLFFMFGWDRYGFAEKHVGTRYAELVFFHPMGSMGHVLHPGASRERNIDA